MPTITGGNCSNIDRDVCEFAHQCQNQVYSSGTGLPVPEKSTLGDAITINNPTATLRRTISTNIRIFTGWCFGGPVRCNSISMVLQPLIRLSNRGGATLTGTVTALSAGASIAPEEQAGLFDGSMFGLVNGNPAPTLNNNLNAGPGNVVYAYRMGCDLGGIRQPGKFLDHQRNSGCGTVRTFLHSAGCLRNARFGLISRVSTDETAYLTLI